MKLIIKLLCVIVLTVPVFTGVACSVNSATPNVAVGRITDYRPDTNLTLEMKMPAPDFQFTTAAGQTLLFSSLQNKVILVNFWSVDCPYCVQEMPFLEQAYREYQNQGLVVLAVNTGETESKVAKFLSQRKLTFEIVLDPDVYVSTVYQARYLPTTYIIDKTGKIVDGKIGAFSNIIEIMAAVKPYLN
jgi:peroxiredoxin